MLEACSCLYEETGGRSDPECGKPSSLYTAHASIEYGTSKWAIRGFIRYLAEELGPYKICVNVCAPGKIWTKLSERNGINASAAMVIAPEQYWDAARKTIPMGRLQISEEVAGRVHFLASEDATAIHGQTILVNGGEERC